jgi:hypothetical protein
MLNQVLVSGACCCLQLCCKECSETLFKLMGRIAFIKLMYVLIYFSFIIFVYAAMYLLREWEFFMQVLADGINCLALTAEFDCVSASVIYRITLSLFLFSTLMLILLLACSSRVAAILNESLFFSKFVLMVAIFLGSLQLDDSLLASFSDFCQLFSYVFIVWQVPPSALR